MGATSITRTWPPSSVLAEPSWKEEYVADLTTLGSASYAHDATKVINGVTWLAEANPVVELEGGGSPSDPQTPEGTISSDGNGLTILSDGDSVDLIRTGITAPFFSFKLADAVSGLNNLDTIAVQVLASELSTRNNTWEGYGTALYTPHASGLDDVTKLVHHINWCVPDGEGSWSGGYTTVFWGHGGTRGGVSGAGGGGTIDTDTTSGVVNARNIALETLFNFNGQTGVLGHTVSTSTSLAPFTPFDKNRRYVAGDVLASVHGASLAWDKDVGEGLVSTLNSTNPPAWSLQASTARFGIGVFTADDNDADDFSVRFTRVRVLRLGGSGGGAV